MNKLRILTKFHSTELSGLRLPVDICRLDLTRVTTVIAGQEALLPDGRYLLRLVLPAGLEITSLATVPGQTEVTLELEAARHSPREVEEVQRFVRGSAESAIGVAVASRLLTADVRELVSRAGGLTSIREGAGALATVFRQRRTTKSSLSSTLRSLGMRGETADEGRNPSLRGFSGNPLLEVIEINMQAAGIQHQSVTPTSVELELPPQISLVQLVQKGVAPLNVMLPADLYSPAPEHVHAPITRPGSRLTLTLCDDGEFLVAAHPSNVMADALLSYDKRGLASAAKSMADPLSAAASDTDENASLAERLLEQKKLSPIGAAVGAYVLLRLGETNRLHNWSANLFNWMPFLPDGAVIYSEHLAREGDHSKALETLLSLSNRGLPIFVEGLSYAVERLELYCHAEDERLRATDVDSARSLLKRLRPFSCALDFSRQIVSYHGVDPTAPGEDAVVDRIYPEAVMLQSFLV